MEIEKLFFSDIQIKTFLKIIFYQFLFLSIYLILIMTNSIKFRSIFFNVISILTGTGYVNAQFDNWGSFPLVLFLALNVYWWMCWFNNVWY